LAVIVNAVVSARVKRKHNLKSHQTSTRLYKWRITAGLSLEEESDLTGYSTAMLSLAERGLREFSPMAKVQIARRLGVAISDLFEIEPIPKDERPGAAAS
jgi:transcriptional regulator with XRE-family HTH domain